MSNTPEKRQGRPQSGLRAALAAKTSLRTWHDIAVVPGEQIEAAQRDLEVARQLLAATLVHDNPDVRARAQEAHTAAEAARAECFHRIYFRGLGFDEFDALVALHPPTPEEAAEGYAWCEDTFQYALLEECAEDADGNRGDLTADEWRTELGDETRWAAPDRRQVLAMSLAAQRQTMADAVPKG